MHSYIGQVHNEVVSIGLSGCLFDLLLCHVRPAISDVLSDGGGKEDGLLTHNTDHLPQVADVKRTDVVTVNAHLQLHTVFFKVLDKHLGELAIVPLQGLRQYCIMKNLNILSA